MNVAPAPSLATVMMIRLFTIVALLTGMTSWAVLARQAERLSEPDLVGTWRKVSPQDDPVQLRLEFFDDGTFNFELNNVCSSTPKTYHMAGTWRQRRTELGYHYGPWRNRTCAMLPREWDDLISNLFLSDGYDWDRLQFLALDRIRLWDGEYVRERVPRPR